MGGQAGEQLRAKNMRAAYSGARTDTRPNRVCPSTRRNIEFWFSSKKVKIDNVKVLYLLVVIIDESWYNQAYIFFIIELWSPIIVLKH